MISLSPRPDASAVLLGLVFIGLTIHLERKKDSAGAGADGRRQRDHALLSGDNQPRIAHATGTAVAADGPLAVVAVFAAISASAPIVQADLRTLWFTTRKPADWVRYLVPAVAALVLVAAAFLMLIEPAGAIYRYGDRDRPVLVSAPRTHGNLLLAGRFEIGLAWSVTREHDADANDGT